MRGSWFSIFSGWNMPPLAIPSWLKRAHAAPALVILANFVLRLVYFFHAKNTFFFERPFLDAKFYYQWALEIVSGDWIGSRRGVFVMSPGYPYFLAIVNALFGPAIKTIVLVQFMLGLGCGLMIYFLGKQHISRQAGLVGAAIFLLNPLELFFESTLLKASLVNAVNMGALLAASTTSPAGWILAGLLTGMSAHLRPTALLLVPVILFWLGRRSRRDASVFVLFLGGLLAALLPVALRNYHVSGEWVWTTAHGGMNFYTGNSPEGKGPYQMLPFAHTDVEFEQDAFLSEARRRSGQDLTPAQASDFWYAESIRFIRTDPIREAGLLLKKAVIFFNEYEPPINLDYNFLRQEFGSVLSLPLPSFALLLPLAVLGMIRAAPNFLLIAYLMVVFFSNVIFFVSSEYRFPVVPVLSLYAGHAICILAQDARRRSTKKLVLSCGAVVLLLAFAKLDIYTHLIGMPDYKREIAANTLFNLGLEYHMAGRDDEAIGYYTRSVGLHPDVPVVQNNLGIVLARRGRLSEAIPHFERALHGFPDAYHNLGRALMLLGRHEEAEKRLQQVRGLTHRPEGIR